MDDIFARYREALRLGHQHAAEGRYNVALGHYQTAAQLAGARALPHVGVGGMLLRLGRAREALEAYDRALALEPDNLDALTGRAAALLGAGRRAEALAVQQRIATLRTPPRPAAGAPAGDQTPMSTADALAVAAQRAQSAGDGPAAIEAWLAASRAHAASGHYDAALDAALRALAVDAAAVHVHLEMARVYFERGWHERGHERAGLLRQLLDLEPDPAVALQVDELSRRASPAPVGG